MIAEDIDTGPHANAANFYSNLLAGNFAAILGAFEGEPSIDSPRGGLVAGYDEVAKFLAEEKEWLESMGASIDKLKLVKNTTSPERVVHEVGIHMPIPPVPRPIMFANVADIGIEGITTMRLYYSYGFLTNNQQFVRKAMLPTDDTLIEQIPAPVRRYVDEIAAADFDVYKLFPEDGYLMGVPSVPFKGEKLIRFFAIAMAEDGGVPLRWVTVTSDEHTCAIEENLASWGAINFEDDTAGLAVYDYNSKGQVTAARIYDDIPVNPFSKPGWVHKNWSKVSSCIAAAGAGIPFEPTADTTPLEIKKKLLF